MPFKNTVQTFKYKSFPVHDAASETSTYVKGYKVYKGSGQKHRGGSGHERHGLKRKAISAPENPNTAMV